MEDQELNDLIKRKGHLYVYNTIHETILTNLRKSGATDNSNKKDTPRSNKSKIW